MALESEAVRESLDVGYPLEGSIYARTTVTSTETFRLPATDGVSKFWTFQAVTSAVYILINTDGAATITTGDRSGLTGTTLTADVNNAYLIPAGQERSFRIPSQYYVSHISADASGILLFYQSSGNGAV